MSVAAGIHLSPLARETHELLREPFGVLHGALLGLVALILAFGLSLAVGRYESRRAAVVDDASAIDTACPSRLACRHGREVDLEHEAPVTGEGRPAPDDLLL